MTEELKTCPFCGREAEGETRELWPVFYKDPYHWRIECDCGARGSRDATLEAARKSWNTRTSDHELATLRAQNALLEEEIARLTKLTSPAWFYFDDDQCRFGVHEIIDEDFCWDNRKTGEHVIEIATAGPLPTIWAHVKFLTDEEKAALETDDDYILTEYSTETEARNALAQVAK